MNKGLSLIFIGMAILLTSCKKELLQLNSNGSRKQQMSLLSESSYTSIKRPQGLYLDSSFLPILGDSTKEDSLIEWAVVNNINKFSYYRMNTILASSGSKSQLASFIVKAKTEGIEDHVAIMGGESTFTLIKNYNSAQSANARFTSIQIEDEWWQSSRSISDYYNVVDLLKSMKSWSASQSPAVSVDLYFGRFNNMPGTNAQAADTLVKYSDRVLIANELDDPLTNVYPTHIQNRVNEFDNAADRASKWYPIVIIFYPGQAPLYYGNHTYQFAFTNFTGRSWDDFIRNDDIVHGYQVFAYTEAIDLRPLPKNVTFYVGNSPSKPISGQLRIYDATNSLIDTQNFSANINTTKVLKQPSSWRLEVDATNTGSVRYVMEIYIDGDFVEYYILNPGTTRTAMKVPYPTGYHNLTGNVTLTFYPG